MYSKSAKIFGFRQILTASLAFVNSISKALHTLMPDLPVFVLVSGDNNYIMNEKFETVSKELYEKSPRFVIRFESFDRDQSTDTAVFNRYEFISQDEEDDSALARCVIRRLCTYMNCNCTMVSPNFISALMHLEMIYSIFSRENPFTYEYQGSTFNAGFTSETQDFSFPELDSGSRNFTQNINVKVQLHVYTPRIETVVLAEDYDYDEIRVDIYEKNVNNRVEVSPEETDYKRVDTDVETEYPSDGREDNEYPYTKVNN